MTGTGPSDDDIALAGEYVLNLLEGAEKRAFEARLDAEPALRLLVAGWQEDLVPLADAYAPAPPPRRARAAIEARLFPTRRERRTNWLGGLLVTAVLAGLIVLLMPTIEAPVRPDYRAEITDDTTDALVVTVSIVAERAEARIEGLTIARPAGRVLQLWFQAAGADAPISLGLVPPGDAPTLPIPPEVIAMMDGGLLGLSVEPPGGSPTGRPSGPVLGHGDLTAI